MRKQSLPLATDLKWLAEVRSSGGLEDTTGVFRPSEQNDRASIRLLAQSLDDVVEDLVVRGARHFQRRRDADVALCGLAREHLDTVFAVAAFGIHGGNVRPVGDFHYIHQCNRLEGIWRHRSSKVVEPEER